MGKILVKYENYENVILIPVSLFIEWSRFVFILEGWMDIVKDPLFSLCTLLIN